MPRRRSPRRWPRSWASPPPCAASSRRCSNATPTCGRTRRPVSCECNCCLWPRKPRTRPLRPCARNSMHAAQSIPAPTCASSTKSCPLARLRSSRRARALRAPPRTTTPHGARRVPRRAGPLRSAWKLVGRKAATQGDTPLSSHTNCDLSTAKTSGS